MLNKTIERIQAQVERLGQETDRFSKTITLKELKEIDSEAVKFIVDETNYSLEKEVELIITDWSISCYADKNGQEELFAEPFENFSSELKNYLKVF